MKQVNHQIRIVERHAALSREQVTDEASGQNHQY
jgi:hypothetical protein